MRHHDTQSAGATPTAIRKRDTQPFISSAWKERMYLIWCAEPSRVGPHVPVVVCARVYTARRAWRQACQAARSRAIGSCARLPTFASGFSALRFYGPCHPGARTHKVSGTLL